jgi:hypothetical protein
MAVHLRLSRSRAEEVIHMDMITITSLGMR